MFGAAVRGGGRASPTLARRIELAAEAARRFPDAPLFLSGAVGRFPPSEAAVMATALATAVAPGRLILDEDSCDTLQSAQAAARYARRRGLTRCIVCTDRYHQPRARMLLRLFGMPSEGYWFTHRNGGTRAGYRWRMRLREGAALPYDFVAGIAAITRAGREPR